MKLQPTSASGTVRRWNEQETDRYHGGATSLERPESPRRRGAIVCEMRPAEARLESRPRYKALLLAARPMAGATANAAIGTAAFAPAYLAIRNHAGSRAGAPSGAWSAASPVGGAASTSRIFAASAVRVNGLAMKCTPWIQHAVVQDGIARVAGGEQHAQARLRAARRVRQLRGRSCRPAARHR